MNIVGYVTGFENRGKYKNLPMTAKEVLLTDNEQQILPHVCEYTVFALKKKYNLLSKSSKSKEVAIAALRLLGTFTKGQISRVHNFFGLSRLIEEKDEFYLFIKSMENLLRKTLNISLIRRYEGYAQK